MMTAGRPSSTGRLLENLSRSQWFCRLLAAVVLFVGVVSFAQRFQDAQFDFASDYATAQAELDGENPYGNALSEVEERVPEVAVLITDPRTFPYWRPPVRFIISWPFTLLGFTTAAAIWVIFEALSLVSALFLFGRSLGWKLPTALVVGIGALSFPAVAQNLGTGQIKRISPTAACCHVDRS
jgi:hypothetical protein